MPVYPFACGSHKSSPTVERLTNEEMGKLLRAQTLGEANPIVVVRCVNGYATQPGGLARAYAGSAGNSANMERR